MSQPITWQSVMAPSFFGANQQFQTASDYINRAINGAQGMVQDQIQQRLAQREADKRYATQRLLQDALSTQDPNQYAVMQKRLSSGLLNDNTQLAPENITPEALQMLDQRGDVLRTRNEQNYQQTKERSLDEGEKIVGPLLAKYAGPAYHHFENAAAGFAYDAEAAGLPADQIGRYLTTLRGMQDTKDPLAWIRVKEFQNSEQARLTREEALKSVQYLNDKTGDNPTAILDHLNSLKDKMIHGVPVKAVDVRDAIDNIMIQRDPTWATKYAGMHPTYGQFVSNEPALADGQTARELRTNLNDLLMQKTNELSPYARIYQKLDQSPPVNGIPRASLTPHDAADQLIHEYAEAIGDPKGVNGGQIQDLITHLVEQTGISAPAAAEVIAMSANEGGWGTIEDLAKGYNLPGNPLQGQKAQLIARAKQALNGQPEWEQYKKRVAGVASINNDIDTYEQKNQSLNADLAAARFNPNRFKGVPVEREELQRMFDLIKKHTSVAFPNDSSTLSSEDMAAIQAAKAHPESPAAQFVLRKFKVIP